MDDFWTMFASVYFCLPGSGFCLLVGRAIYILWLGRLLWGRSQYLGGGFLKGTSCTKSVQIEKKLYARVLDFFCRFHDNGGPCAFSRYYLAKPVLLIRVRTSPALPEEAY